MGPSSHLQFRFDAFELDEADARLKRDGRPVALAPKAFGVLCELARTPGVLVTKNALLDAVWGHQHVSESVLKTTISQVRAALADDASNPRYIETASRLGYRFIGAANGAANGPAMASPKSAAPVASPAAAIPESFIGRRAALDRLQEAWTRAGNGQRQLLWVAGDAGVGKSTLLETFVRLSGAAGIGQGQCVEQYGSGEPYLPVLHALGDLCREYPELGPMMRAAAPTWLLQIPWLVAETERGALARELAGISPERMVREFHELIVRFSEKRPLLFVLEDLHWSDEATLRLMNHFARQRTPARVLWIGSFRLTQVIAEGHPLQSLRQELRLHKLCDEIVLDPFSEAEVQEYLRGRAPPAQVPEAFIRRVHAHTDGLPLFVANVVDALLGQEEFVANAPLPVPEDLMGAVETRIGRLPADVVTLLQAAAVFGVEFRAGAVAEAAGQDLARVIEVCDQLAKQQYWLRHVGTVDLTDGTLDATYSFRHAIYRHVFYHRLGAAPRVQLHRRAAQVLIAGAAKGLPAAPAELASHHERGRELAAALGAYAQAGHAALRSFAPMQALELCEHASGLLTQVPAGPERLALELAIQGPRGVATAQIHGVGSAEARVVFERVHDICNQLPRHPARAIALNGYGASLYTRGEYQKLMELADEIDALEKGPDSPALMVMTCLFRGGVTLARGQCRESVDWWRKAIAWCESITDRTKFPAFIVDPECGIRANSVRAFFQRGLFDEARKQAALAIEISQRLGQPLAQVLAHWRAGMLEVRLGRPEKVLEHAEKIASVVSKTYIAQGDGPGRYLRGWAQALLGEPRAGYDLIRDGLERHLRIGMIANSTEILAYAAEALILAGDYDGASGQLAEAFARSRELDEQDYLPILLMLQARVAQGLDDGAAAYRWLGEGVRVARSQESAGMELKVSCARAEHPLATGDDRRELAALLESLTEGHDIADMQRARGLIGARS